MRRACVLAALLGAVGSPAHALDFFVATNGLDTATGTSAHFIPGSNTGPFLTLERARDAIRDLKRQAGLPPEGVTVWVGEGTHLRTAPFVLTAEDSGAPGQPVRYRAHVAERPLISGARPVGALLAPPSLTNAVARLPRRAREKALVASLGDVGIAAGDWLVTTGFTPTQRVQGAELAYLGKAARPAGWPNMGYDTGAAEWTPTGCHIRRPASTEGTEPAWLRLPGRAEWGPLTRVESGDGPVYAAEGLTTDAWRQADGRVSLCGGPEEIDSPGEYAIDSLHGWLILWPLGPVEAENLAVWGVAGSVIQAEWATNVWLEGLWLEGARGDGVRITGGTGVRVVGCRVDGVSGHGVVLDGGASNCVEGCHIREIGGDGIRLEGSPDNTAAWHRVDNTFIERFGRLAYGGGAGIRAGPGTGVRVANNRICHAAGPALQLAPDTGMAGNDCYDVENETVPDAAQADTKSDAAGPGLFAGLGRTQVPPRQYLATGLEFLGWSGAGKGTVTRRGRVRLSLSNRGDIPMGGEVILGLSPAGAGLVRGRTTVYGLQPGLSTSVVCTLTVTTAVEQVWLFTQRPGESFSRNWCPVSVPP